MTRAAGAAPASLAPEAALARFIVGLEAPALPAPAARIVRRALLAVVGTGIAGAGEEGIEALRQLLRSRGGAGQAQTLVFGERLPANAAAQLNGTMCRALDFCDAMAPGPHFGAAVFPAALAAAQLVAPPTVSGARFFAALAAGLETGARFNLDESQYDGFDPSGVAAVFGATAAAAHLLGLSESQTVHALGLAFNRCGGSFQSHVDGSLAVRLTQGIVAAAGVECAQMALAGLTGPTRFLTGVYGYPHLYGRGRLDPGSVVAGLGEQWRLTRIMFKPYPSCGATQGLTALTLQCRREHALASADIDSVLVRLNPYCHRLVGHEFVLGTNPRVNAQFSAQWCIANAIVRGGSKLAHFRPEAVADPEVLALVQRVRTEAAPALDARGHTAVDLEVRTRDGRAFESSLDIAPGFPGNDLSDAQHDARFADCMAYAAFPPRYEQAARLRAAIEGIEALSDIGALLGELTVRQAS